MGEAWDVEGNYRGSCCTLNLARPEEGGFSFDCRPGTLDSDEDAKSDGERVLDSPVGLNTCGVADKELWLVVASAIRAIKHIEPLESRWHNV